ncbi:hypothetical protein HK405_002591, partial [Cladochytrium tenue]
SPQPDDDTASIDGGGIQTEEDASTQRRGSAGYQTEAEAGYLRVCAMLETLIREGALAVASRPPRSRSRRGGGELGDFDTARGEPPIADRANIAVPQSPTQPLSNVQTQPLAALAAPQLPRSKTASPASRNSSPANPRKLTNGGIAGGGGPPPSTPGRRTPPSPSSPTASATAVGRRGLLSAAGGRASPLGRGGEAGSTPVAANAFGLAARTRTRTGSASSADSSAPPRAVVSGARKPRPASA